MKALVGAFNQKKALVGAFSVILNLQKKGSFEALSTTQLSKQRGAAEILIMPTCLLPKLIFIVIHEQLSVIPIIIIRLRPSLEYAELKMGLTLAS